MATTLHLEHALYALTTVSLAQQSQPVSHVQMAISSKQTAPVQLVVPHLHLTTQTYAQIVLLIVLHVIKMDV